MSRRAHATFATAAALLALTMQWCIPFAHALHVGHARHAAAHAPPSQPGQGHHGHQHDGHGEDPRGGHDESQCPTCQQFVVLRSFAPLAVPVTLAEFDATASGAALAYDAPFVSRSHHAPAVPRGPPGP
jgi:hypothetical protein